MRPKILMVIFKAREMSNHGERQKDLTTLSNLVIKWQMEFHIDKAMHTFNKKT